MEAYNFWQNTKREIRVYERAGSLRVYVPADVTYMPASVMETLRVENVPVVLQWQGHRIEIPAGKAPAQAAAQSLLADENPVRTLQRIKFQQKKEPFEKGSFLLCA